MIYKSIVELVGNTPLLRLNNIEREYNLDNELYAKIEKNNPAGSIKDRAVLKMLQDYQNTGINLEGKTIIEATSGNTGIALCAFSNYFKFKAIIVMPNAMSEERKSLIKAYNGELLLINGGMNACEEKAKELEQTIPNSFIFGQFENLSNPIAHYETTSVEIAKDIPDVDFIFAGIGTGGTISGIASYFAKYNNKVKVIGVEPLQSPLLTRGITGLHKIQGIGADFVPHTLDLKNIYKIIDVDDERSIAMAKTITKCEGLLVGISSGAALLSALQFIKEQNIKHKKIVLIFPDTGERYKWN